MNAYWLLLTETGGDYIWESLANKTLFGKGIKYEVVSLKLLRCSRYVWGSNGGIRCFSQQISLFLPVWRKCCHTEATNMLSFLKFSFQHTSFHEFCLPNNINKRLDNFWVSSTPQVSSHSTIYHFKARNMVGRLCKHVFSRGIVHYTSALLNLATQNGMFSV